MSEMAWLDQRATLLGEGRTILEAFQAANPGLDPTRSRHALARYMFEGAAALAAVDELSGGERIRAALACTVGAHRPPQLLFLDEPTNHLDLESLAAVESTLRAYDGALVVVSHDEDFLGAIDVQRRVELGMA
jgi:ATPase subunit of ABC transporter with duplicated ATPase domains